MTDYTTNLSIPLLDQNVAEPEIPENTAKDIIDKILSGRYTWDFASDADITITHTQDPTAATPWQNGIFNFTSSVALTGTRNVILPDNQRTYIIENNTGYAIQFKTSAGTGITIADGQNFFGFCDGTDILRLNFIASGSNTLLEAMTDTPSGYGSLNNVLISNGTDAFTYYDLALKANAAGATLTTATINGGTLSNTTTNSGTISGGTISGFTVKNYGETSNTPTSSTNALEIDLSDGNVVLYTAIENTEVTLTTTHTNTSFTMRATNLGAFTVDFSTNQTVEWEGGVEPTWTVSGVDLITFTKIGSIWTAGALLDVGVPA